MGGEAEEIEVPRWVERTGRGGVLACGAGTCGGTAARRGAKSDADALTLGYAVASLPDVLLSRRGDVAGMRGGCCVGGSCCAARCCCLSPDASLAVVATEGRLSSCLQDAGCTERLLRFDAAAVALPLVPAAPDVDVDANLRWLGLRMLSFCRAPVAPMGTRKSRDELLLELRPKAPDPEPAEGPPTP